MNPVIFGPTPTLNSSTSMFMLLAAKKCPASWINTTKARVVTDTIGDDMEERTPIAFVAVVDAKTSDGNDDK